MAVFARPILFAEHNHGRIITCCTVVILRRVLEYFLARAGATGGENDAVAGYHEQPVFANRVREIFRDMRREGRGRLMSIKPCGDADAEIPGFITI